jgi:signal transduction histidine kinase
MAEQLKTFDNNNRVINDTILRRQERGKLIMDDLRSTASLMEREQNRLLESRETRLKRIMDTITVITIITLGMVISLLIFGFKTYMQVSRQRKKAEQDIRDYQLALNQRINALDEANAELIKMRSMEKFAVTGRIARTIGHEVRNPLTNIILATEQIRLDINDAAKNKEYLFQMIERNCSRINQLISDLLDSTKVSEMNIEKISVHQLLDETLEEAKDRIALTNVRIIKEYNKEDCFINVDIPRMKIALLNLVTNALEAMQGKQNGEITIRTAVEKNGCIIRINDNGPGMDAETLARIFEPYYTTKKSGNGLGLTNTQNIILNHKGDISAESLPGKGTVFSINLPLG